MKLSEMSKRLRYEIRHIVPVPDSDVTWLSVHRPSIAFAICIGAGPWQIGRRRTVQQSFIDALCDQDLSSTSALKRLHIACQLDWQTKWFDTVHDILRLCRPLKLSFDQFFTFDGFEHWIDRRQQFEKFFGYQCDPYAFPKVVQLFLRDYLFVPCFPIDRHVRRWLSERGLPTKSSAIVQLFFELHLNPSGYSRAIFNSKAENATFTATR
jgi:hypothetical protein